MGNKKLFTYVLSFLLMMSFVAFDARSETLDPPKTLMESIHIAILYNAKTRSKDVEEEKYRLQTEAVRARRLPSASFSCNHQKYQSEQRPGEADTWQEIQQRSTYCGIDLSLSVWDNGSKRNAVKAAEMREAWIRNFNNSTNPLTLYTKGTIANAVINNYVSLVMFKEVLETYHVDLEFLDTLMKWAQTDEDKNRIRVERSQKEASISNTESSYFLTESDFFYNTTIKPADEISRYESTINDLLIPENADVAMEVALEKSPDIQARRYALEAADYDYKSARGALGPQVSLGIHRDTVRNWDPRMQNSIFYTNSHYIGLTLSVPLNVSSHYSLKAQSRAREQAALEMEASLDDAKHTLVNTYMRLGTLMELEKKYRKNLEELDGILENILKDFEKGGSHRPSIKYAMDQRDARNGAFMSWQGVLSEIVSYKSSVLQVTGTLFDEVNPDKAKQNGVWRQSSSQYSIQMIQ